MTVDLQRGKVLNTEDDDILFYTVNISRGRVVKHTFAPFLDTYTIFGREYPSIFDHPHSVSKSRTHVTASHGPVYLTLAANMGPSRVT